LKTPSKNSDYKVSSQAIVECLETEWIKMGAVVWSIIKDYHATEGFSKTV